jgi:hypothetical protein
MGIDKANVRYIIHYELPRSFEGEFEFAFVNTADGLAATGYYQETGEIDRLRKVRRF